jgi:hypothetical protein
LTHKTNLTLPLFIKSCTKPGKWEVMYLCVRGIKPEKWEVMYLCVRGINCAFYYNFSIGSWNCSDSVVFF